ncbi:MAG: ATP-binding protein [Chloroflexota bacterium]
MLNQVLEVNWIILYFIYGQVFFIMGLVTGLQWRRESRLEIARALPWLAGFGIAHGLNEWGYIFVPLQSLYLDDQYVRIMMIGHLILLSISFFSLLQFGVELVLSERHRRSPLRAVPSIALATWGVLILWRANQQLETFNVLLAIGDSWSRYLLCLPGALLVFFGLRQQSGRVRELDLQQVSFSLSAAAVAFLVYGFVGGIIVPSTPLFPSTILNSQILINATRIPAPVLRSICGAAMAFFVVRSLSVFRVETDRRIAGMELEQKIASDRERIGRELHDGTIQNLFAAGLSLERLQKHLQPRPDLTRRTETIMDTLDRTVEGIRQYIFDLHPSKHYHKLESVLDRLVSNFREDTMLEVELQVTGTRCCTMSPHQASHLTQIVREALSNVVQHADAEQAVIELEYYSDALSLKVIDNGKGMIIDSIDQIGKLGHGITNMRHRARQLGGKLELSSHLGDGLVVHIYLPCCSEQNAIIPKDMSV